MDIEPNQSSEPDEQPLAAPPPDAPSVEHADLSEWRGRDLYDRDGEQLGRLEDVYYDVETDEAQFGTLKEGFLNRHLTFVPLVGVIVGPDRLQLAVTRDQVKSAPNLAGGDDVLTPADESALYHHYELNYVPTDRKSGRRLVRR